LAVGRRSAVPGRCRGTRRSGATRTPAAPAPAAAAACGRLTGAGSLGGAGGRSGRVVGGDGRFRAVGLPGDGPLGVVVHGWISLPSWEPREGAKVRGASRPDTFPDGARLRARTTPSSARGIGAPGAGLVSRWKTGARAPRPQRGQGLPLASPGTRSQPP